MYESLATPRNLDSGKLSATRAKNGNQKYNQILKIIAL